MDTWGTGQHVWPRVGNEHGIADEDEVAGGFTSNRFAPDIHACHFEVVERPTGDWDRANNARSIICWSVEAAERWRTSGVSDVHLDR